MPKTVKSRAARRAAVAAPIPDEAPVMRTERFMRGGMLPLSGDVFSTRHALRVLVLLLLATACQAESEPAPRSVAKPETTPRTAWAEIGSGLFELELAIDPRTRFRGLGGRTSVAPDGGMLFAANEACSAPVESACSGSAKKKPAKKEGHPPSSDVRHLFLLQQ